MVFPCGILDISKTVTVWKFDGKGFKTLSIHYVEIEELIYKGDIQIG
jgi:hypothetical protein